MPQHLSLDDFEYDLPPELIAQEPPAIRHASRLMHVDRRSGALAHHSFSDLPDLLLPGDVLVVNDTKVIPARLVARRQTGAVIDILLLKAQPDRPGIWLAMAAPLKKLRAGEYLILDNIEAFQVQVAGFVEGPDGQRRVVLDFGSQANVYRALSESGLAPLPPYIHRDNEGEASPEHRVSDLERYQTIFAQSPGAVAAPTAGLHFSAELFERLAAKGVLVEKITLHVGPGTFKPITSSLDSHTIEAEHFVISEATAAAVNLALDEGRRVIAVGTTSCRALETAGAESGRVKPVSGASTSLYIMPGHKFSIVSAMITNFHLSKSSLLVMVSAIAGHELIMRSYKVAVDERYRFFSYGDAMFIT